MTSQGIYYEPKLHQFARDFHSDYRFGHTSSIQSIFQVGGDEGEDYVSGVAMTVSLVLIPGVIWILILIILRLLDHRVGCASGQPITIPGEEVGDNNKIVANANEFYDQSHASEYCDLTEEYSGRQSRKSSTISESDETEYFICPSDNNRVCFSYISFISAGALTLFGSLSFVAAISYSMISISDAHLKVSDIRNLIPDAMSSTSRIITDLSTQIDNDRNIISAHLNGGICAIDSYALRQVYKKNTTTIIYQYNSSMQVLHDRLDPEDWIKFREMLVDSDHLLSDILNLLESGSAPTVPWYISGLVLSILIIVTTIFLMATARSARKEGYQLAREVHDLNSRKECILMHSAIPLLALLIITAWIGTSALTAINVVNSDFCFDEIKTGQTVLEILSYRNHQEGSQLYESVDKYLHGCSPGIASPLLFINDHVVVIQDIIANIDDFISWAEQVNGAKTYLCFDQLQKSLLSSRSMYSTLEEFSTEVKHIQNLSSCDRLASKLQEVMYGSVCNSTPIGFLWCFLSTLLVSISGMVMITLRSSLYRARVYTNVPLRATWN